MESKDASDHNALDLDASSNIHHSSLATFILDCYCIAYFLEDSINSYKSNNICEVLSIRDAQDGYDQTASQNIKFRHVSRMHPRATSFAFY